MAGLIKEQLRQIGLDRVTKVHCTETALMRLQYFAYDAVLYNMATGPQGDLAFVRSLRRDNRNLNPFVAIVCMSDIATITKVAACRDAGADAFLARPVSANQLREKICGAVSSKRPFVVAPAYIGPERRREDDAMFLGEDRRVRRMGQIVPRTKHRDAAGARNTPLLLEHAAHNARLADAG